MFYIYSEEVYNISSCVPVLQTEDGREVLKTSCLVVIYATEPALAELGMMLLVNVLSAEHGLETTSPKTTLGIDLMTKVGVAAGR